MQLVSIGAFLDSLISFRTIEYITYIDNIQIKAFQKTQTVFLKG